MIDVIVLGCGWSGIIFALEFKLRFPDADVVILEKSEGVGGLLRSVSLHGHVFDIGGSHVIFSRNKDILNRMLLLLKDNSIKHFRNSYVRINSSFVPYPLENGLYALPQDERAEALISFLEAWLSRSNCWRPRNLEEWIYSFFGKWIGDKYLIPYNKKVWKRPLDKIGVDWVYTPGRLPTPNWRDVVKSAFGIPTVGYPEQNLFYYPMRGGIQALFDSALKEAQQLGVKVVNNVAALKIRRMSNEWVINGTFKAKRLVSTIPLKELVKALDAPSDIVKASEELEHNGVAVVGIALDKPAPRQHWIYVPNPDIIFHRYAWISNYSPRNASSGRSTVIAEITLQPNTQINAEKILEYAVEGLERLGVIKWKEILFTKVWLHEYGYPVYTIARDDKRKIINDWLNKHNIKSVGRWGSWHYWNMDKVYEKVLENICNI